MRGNKQFVRGLVCVLAGATLIGGNAGCNPARTDCTDGIDNDGDGLYDNADPGCAFLGGNTEAPDPPQCQDGRDNDTDGVIDFPLDEGCSDGTDDDESGPVRACNNGQDDDGDGRIDFPTDPGCETSGDDDESNAALCADGVDNDMDGKTDYPFEPGCASLDDDDETDPSPLPKCANGLDDDTDAKVDFPADPGCSAMGDNDEFNTVEGPCGASMLEDITATGVADGSSLSPRPNSLESPICRGLGGEFTYQYTVTNGPTSLLVSTDFAQTTLDTVVYVRAGDCKEDASELACDDDGGDVGSSGHASKLIVRDLPDGDYYIIVDAFGATSVGAFHLEVSERTPRGGACDPLVADVCEPGLICRELTPGAPTTCEPHACGDDLDNEGDGKTDFPAEPGCQSLLDDDETDPVPLPACANGGDDDGDTIIDYPLDPGCVAASDNSEIDECLPGVPVIDHPGGTLSGAMPGGASDLAPPAGCTFTVSGDELVYVFELTRAVTGLEFSTVGSVADTVLYVRETMCAVEGPASSCNDNDGASFTSLITLPSPAQGQYFAIVDSHSGGLGDVSLRIRGFLPDAAACTAGDPTYVCGAGLLCRPDGFCHPTLCNDGADNDGDSKADELDPGCLTDDDDDETDPATPPICADGLDNDADLLIDFPMDPGCNRASDDNEMQCTHDLCVTGLTLTQSCDPCVAQICAVDPFCCNTSWDGFCVQEVTSVCGLTCP